MYFENSDRAFIQRSECNLPAAGPRNRRSMIRLNPKPHNLLKEEEGRQSKVVTAHSIPSLQKRETHSQRFKPRREVNLGKWLVAIRTRKVRDGACGR